MAKEFATEKTAEGIKSVATGVAEQLARPIITTQIQNINLAGTNYAIFFFLGSMIALFIFLIAEEIIKKRRGIISK